MIEGMVDDDDMNDYDEYIDDWGDDSNEEEESGDEPHGCHCSDLLILPS